MAGAASNHGSLFQLFGWVSPTALVIVLEDLRRADRDTAELVEYLADNVSGLPLLLVLTLRDGPASTAFGGGALRKSACDHLTPLERLTGDQPATPVPAGRPSGFRTAQPG
jgi:hypothetical protein